MPMSRSRAMPVSRSGGRILFVAREGLLLDAVEPGEEAAESPSDEPWPRGEGESGESSADAVARAETGAARGGARRRSGAEGGGCATRARVERASDKRRSTRARGARARTNARTRAARRGASRRDRRRRRRRRALARDIAAREISPGPPRASGAENDASDQASGLATVGAENPATAPRRRERASDLERTARIACQRRSPPAREVTPRRALGSVARARRRRASIVSRWRTLSNGSCVGKNLVADRRGVVRGADTWQHGRLWFFGREPSVDGLKIPDSFFFPFDAAPANRFGPARGGPDLDASRTAGRQLFLSRPGLARLRARASDVRERRAQPTARSSFRANDDHRRTRAGRPAGILPRARGRGARSSATRRVRCRRRRDRECAAGRRGARHQARGGRGERVASPRRRRRRAAGDARERRPRAALGASSTRASRDPSPRPRTPPLSPSRQSALTQNPTASPPPQHATRTTSARTTPRRRKRSRA